MNIEKISAPHAAMSKRAVSKAGPEAPKRAANDNDKPKPAKTISAQNK
eukprot:CAMPEP_0198539244 /NCGR_PEP_ID=MMETSP1462-20131121/48306_1 /TAXON_ID=1333877 /ORGANISM="Brandtodinium nutriculum, Strain RCC3387" /LENGTH=47 /DNA_ID= /DNA_START= /DNA_END= /DNA_ORIENTATION=